LAGLANSPFHPIDFSILNQRVSQARIGHAFSTHGLAGNIGWGLAPPFFLIMLSFVDWRSAYVGAAILYCIVIAIMAFNRDALITQVVRTNASNPDHTSTTAFLKMPVLWWCFMFFLLSTMTLAMVQGFSGSILQKVHNASAQAAATTVSAYMFCGAFGMFVGGFVATQFREMSERVVAACMVTGAALMAVAASGVLGSLGSMALLAITGFAIGIGGPSRDMMIKRATPKGATGRVYGMVYSGLDIGFALSPVLFGAMMDRGLYTQTLLGGAVVLLFAVGAALAVRATMKS
jgi:MFS transporter, FSR family, fosmidomycin resistance protein